MPPTTILECISKCTGLDIKDKVKQSHYMPGRPWGFQVETPRLQDIQHMKLVRLSALSTGPLYPQEIFLVLISLKGWANHRVIMRPEGLCQWKIPMTPSGIESWYQRQIYRWKSFTFKIDILDRYLMSRTPSVFRVHAFRSVTYKAAEK